MTLTGTDAALHLSDGSLSGIKGVVPTSLEDIPVLGALGTLAAGVTAGDKIYQGIKDPRHHWVDAVEGIGTVGVAIFAPEALLGYALVEMAIDIYRKDDAPKGVYQ